MTTPPPPPESVNPSGAGSSDDKTMAQIAHFGLVIFGFIPPLIIYLIKGDSPWVKREAAKAFNFAIIITAIYVGLMVIGTVLNIADDTGFISLASSCVTCLLWPAAFIVNAIFGIMNGIKVSNNEDSKYPFSLPILK